MSTAAIRGMVRRFVPDEPPSDADLLSRYARNRDSEAFAELLRRHGPMILGVCRRVLANAHDAEDAFQAVFLVLARKAESVRPAGMVGNWLYGVAVRTANKAKLAAARRWRREMATAMAQASREHERPERSQELAELRAVIDQELGRLPDYLRAAVVLCDLGGKSRSEAAREIGCPEGTIAARLHRARKVLAARLAKRGITLPTVGLTTVVTSDAISADLARNTLAAAESFALGLPSPAISPSIQALAEGVLRTMRNGTFALILAAAAVVGMVGGAAAFWSTSSVEPRFEAAAFLEPPKQKLAVPGPWREKAVLTDNEDSISSVAFSPDGKTFAAGGNRRSNVSAWDADTHKQLWWFSADDIRPTPAALAYSPDGKRLALTSKDGVSQVDNATWKTIRSFKEKGAIPTAVAFAPIEDVKGRQLHRLAFTDGRAVWTKTWIDDAQESTARFGPLADAPKVEDPPPSAIAYSNDGKQLVFIPNHKMDGKWIAQVWGGGSGEPMMFLKHGSDPVTAVAWSADGKLIATGGADGNVILWNAATGKEALRVKIEAEKEASTIHALAFAPDGKTLAAAVTMAEGKDAQRVVLLDPAAGKRIQDLLNFPNAPPAAVAFSPDSQTLLVGCGFRGKDPRMLPLDRKSPGELRVFTFKAEAKKP